MKPCLFLGPCFEEPASYARRFALEPSWPVDPRSEPEWSHRPQRGELSGECCVALLPSAFLCPESKFLSIRTDGIIFLCLLSPLELRQLAFLCPAVLGFTLWCSLIICPSRAPCESSSVPSGCLSSKPLLCAGP